MIIDCISDLHGFYPKLEGGDLLIVAGDLTARDTEQQYRDLDTWFGTLDYDCIVVIAGNHDGRLSDVSTKYPPFDNAEYLFDSGTEFMGLKIWGSPWTPTFCNWHFIKDRGEPIKAMWDLIPADTGILVTHGPPYGVNDLCPAWNADEKVHAGCRDLWKTVDERLFALRLHVFGHIHEGYGHTETMGVHFVNASIMNGQYKPVNKPIRVIL